jgi:hypothetical protein
MESRNNDEFESSLLNALDHKEFDKMPKGTFKVNMDKESQGWFNAKSLLKFNENFRNELGMVITNMAEFSKYVLENHISRIANCGETYVPYTIMNGKAAMKFLSRDPQNEEKLQIDQEIANKIFPKMNLADTAIDISGTIDGEELIKSYREDSVTNMWLDGTKEFSDNSPSSSSV